MIKLSVIIPFYNVEKDIERCIKSLLNNINDEVELIFVDDKGQDNSRQIVEQYKKEHKQIKIVTNRVNKKLGPSRISGLKKAQGQWITFVDSDDFVPEDYYKTLFAEMDLDHCLVLFNYNRVDAEGKKVYTYKGHCFKEDEFYLYKLDPAAWNKMYRKDLLEDIPSFNTYVEDIALWPTIIDRTGFNYHISKKVIYNYVANPNSLTANVTDEKREMYYKNFDYIFKNNKSNDGLLIFAHYHLFNSLTHDLTLEEEKAKWIAKSTTYLAKHFGDDFLTNPSINNYAREIKIVAIKKRLPLF